MIDEFQDANTTQDMIFKLLSHNGSAEENGDNLFLVGDVKQSIYRFRLANPGIFVKTLEGSRPYEEKTAHSAILLNRNFRSCEETVDFVNFIFGGIMSKEFGDIDYGENEKLIAGAKYPQRTELLKFSRFLFQRSRNRTTMILNIANIPLSSWKPRLSPRKLII